MVPLAIVFTCLAHLHMASGPRSTNGTTGMPMDKPLHHWPANGPIGRPIVEMLAYWHTIDGNISQSTCQLLLMVHHWHANGE
jgi:hypothetical protein